MYHEESMRPIVPLENFDIGVGLGSQIASGAPAIIYIKTN